MPDNLSFSISVDAQRAKDELALTEAKLRSVRKEVRALADEAVRDPMAVPKLKAANAELAKTEQHVKSLQKDLREMGRSASTAAHGLEAAHAKHAHGFYLVENSVQSLNGAFMAIGHNIAGARAGIVGFLVGMSFQKVIEQIVEANKRLLEFKATAREIGVRPVAVQAAGEISALMGKQSQEGVDFTKAMGAEIEKARQAARQPLGTIGGLPSPASRAQPRVFRGGDEPQGFAVGAGGNLVQTFRGGQKAAADLDEVWGELTKTITQFPSSTQGTLQTLLQFNKNLVELSKIADPQRFNLFTKAHGFGPGEAALEQANAQIASLERKIKELQASNRGATAEHLSQIEQLAAATAKLNQTREEALAPGIRFFNEADLAIMTALTHFFEAPWREKFSELWAGISEDWNTFLAGLNSAWASFWDGIANAATSTWQGVKDAASNTATAIGEAATAAPLPGMAGGGYVHGPGSGTSDSVLARLSAGEFVINSASVRRLGAGFLSGLNGYAAGGLVGVPKFAAGGLVGGGGTPVHLHLDGQSYATHASEGVASALVVAARRQQMRSAGVKPSWYGGRAGA